MQLTNATNLLSQETINAVVTAVGIIGAAWITYKTRVVEVLKRPEDSSEPGKRIRTDDAQTKSVVDTVLNSSIMNGFREQIEWLNSQNKVMRQEIDALHSSQSRSRLNEQRMTEVVRAYAVYGSELINHIELNLGPPAPPYPDILRDLDLDDD